MSFNLVCCILTLRSSGNCLCCKLVFVSETKVTCLGLGLDEPYFFARCTPSRAASFLSPSFSSCPSKGPFPSLPSFASSVYSFPLSCNMNSSAPFLAGDPKLMELSKLSLHSAPNAQAPIAQGLQFDRDHLSALFFNLLWVPASKMGFLPYTLELVFHGRDQSPRTPSLFSQV